jgi:hypothetical protein
MSTPKGWPTQEKDQRLVPQFATVEPVRSLQHGLSVLAHQFMTEVGTDAAEAGSSEIAIVATAHSALAGDVVRLTSGALSGREIKVASVTANLITLAEELPSAVAAAVTFQILRHKYPLVEPTGEVKISGSFSTTEEATAADGGALPAKVKVAGGYDGAAVQVLKTDAQGELQIDVLSSALPSGAATSAIQTDGSQKTQIVDGSGNVISSTANALDVNLKSPITVDVSLDDSNDSVLVYGFDGAANKAIKTDAQGELQVDILTSALPTGAATETTLAAVAADAATIAGAVSSAKVQVDVVTSTLPTGAATELTLADIKTAVETLATTVSATEIQVDVLSSALPTGAATESTLAAVELDTSTLAGCVSGSEVQVDVVSSALPAGAATEAAQTNGSQKAQIVDAAGDIVDVKLLSVALAGTDKGLVTNSIIHGESTAGGGSYVDVKVNPSGALTTESTLAGLDAAVLGQDTMANSLPVVLASDQSSIPVVAATLSVVDLLDAGILDTSSTNIPGSASSPVQVIASTAAAIKALQLLDTTGAFIGVYVGGVGVEVLQLVMGPGSDQTIQHSISSGSRVSLKRLDSTTAVSSGIVAINCLG